MCVSVYVSKTPAMSSCQQDAPDSSLMVLQSQVSVTTSHKYIIYLHWQYYDDVFQL